MNHKLNPIKVLVVDDSAFMRKSISLMLESDPEISVLATARDGRDAIDKIKNLKPDLVTLDVEMPNLDGLSALKIIMKECPVPVLMVSSITTEGTYATLTALDLAAIDFISKDLSSVSANIINVKDELIAKVKAIGRSTSLRERFISGKRALPQTQSVPAKKNLSIPDFQQDYEAVLVGISTGGPQALFQFLPQLPASFPLGIAIVQHMPPRFTKSMAERLDGSCSMRVKEARTGDELLPGTVLIAQGGRQMTFEAGRESLTAIISDEPASTIYRPSADNMMVSAANAATKPFIGLIMTGMGKDGLHGLRLIKNKGGCVIAQNEQTCVVYGMPKAAVDDGIADYVLPLEQIPAALLMVAGAQSGIQV